MAMFLDWMSRKLFPSKWFTCARCGGVWRKGWSDEECQSERAENGWADVPDEEVVLVCEDCYQYMRAAERSYIALPPEGEG